MRITKNAAIILARTIISCLPLKENVFGQKERDFLDRVRASKEMLFEEFAQRFSLEKSTYRSIVDFAQAHKDRLINETLLVDFFGGFPHFEKIVGQIKEQIPNFDSSDYAKKILFAHMLLPIEIVSVGEEFSGIYKNRDIIIPVKNFVLLSDDAKVKVGQEVLVHYASIIATKFDERAKKRILEVQYANDDFRKSCQYLSGSGIDYKKFLDLCDGTKDAAKNCCT